jgi:hypothetical protein
MNQAGVEDMIRQILATLKYQEIPELMGRSLHISSAETAPEEVLNQCRDALPSSIQFLEPGLKGRQDIIAQYGILDLTYGIAPEELQSLEPGGRSLADELGLFQDVEGMVQENGGWEAELWGDLAQGNGYVRLFLRTWEHLTPEEREHRRKHGLPRDFFIQTYRILDACLTNTSWVWFIKHFYA